MKQIFKQSDMWQAKWSQEPCVSIQYLIISLKLSVCFPVCETETEMRNILKFFITV